MAAIPTQPDDLDVLTLSNGLRIFKLDYTEDLDVDVVAIEPAPAKRPRRRFSECGCLPYVGRGGLNGG